MGEGNMDGAEKKRIIKCRNGECEEVDDLVAEERRVRISINGKPLLALYCTPLKVRELVVGLLMTEGVAEGLCTERMSIVYGTDIDVDAHAEGQVRAEGATVTSGCCVVMSRT